MSYLYDVIQHKSPSSLGGGIGCGIWCGVFFHRRNDRHVSLEGQDVTSSQKWPQEIEMLQVYDGDNMRWNLNMWHTTGRMCRHRKRLVVLFLWGCVCVCAALCAAITRAQNRLRRLSRVLADSFVFQLCFVFVTNYLVQ